MKSLLKFIPMYFIALSSFLCADTQDVKDSEIIKPDETISIENSFGYVSIGLEPRFSFPTLGLGYRIQKNYHGLDLLFSQTSKSGSCSCRGHSYANYFEELYSKRKLSLLYNHFFSPDLNSQLYIGVGLGITYLNLGSCDAALGFSPEVVLGKQYSIQKNYQHFIQIQISLENFYIKTRRVLFSRNCIDKIGYDVRGTLFAFSYGIGF